MARGALVCNTHGFLADLACVSPGPITLGRCPQLTHSRRPPMGVSRPVGCPMTRARPTTDIGGPAPG
ncbi:hypothetical protein HMPREF0321_2709 [Dermacoccus sp. Ellin185]|nr:hypothetical protein HMPREF0321_2709 [Dermacoccus sp. Ellin185]